MTVRAACRQLRAFGGADHVRAAVCVHAEYHPEVMRLLRIVDSSLQSLLRTGGVRTSDPMILNSLHVVSHELTTDDALCGNLLPAWPVDGRIVSPPRAWLPAVPFALLAPLPDAREAYMARFMKRPGLGGWLVQHRPGCPTPALPVSASSCSRRIGRPGSSKTATAS